MTITLQQIKDNGYTIDGIEVKQYLPLNMKEVMIDTIVNLCINPDEDVKQINYILKEFAFDIFMLCNYTNIEEENIKTLEAYDELKENKFTERVLDLIDKDEYWLVQELLDAKLNQIIEQENSIALQLAKGMAKLMTKIPDEKAISKLLKTLPSQINKISPEKLKFVSEAIGWNNGKTPTNKTEA